MPQRKTTEEFIKDAIIIHKDRYNYSLVTYNKSNIKVDIICSLHGTFQQTPNRHLSGNNCPKCRGYNRTTEDFIKDCEKIHNHKYDYSISQYTSSQNKVDIICSIHGTFQQRPYNHLMGEGCPKCAGVCKLSTPDFIKDCEKIHNHKYDYSLVDYVNNYTKIIIICETHGRFNQTPRHHKNGHGCFKCNNNVRTNEEFIKEVGEIHNHKYNYTKTIFNGMINSVDVICTKHGLFNQIASEHMRGSGCPKCKLSKGEDVISKYLDKNNIEYNIEHRFNGCKYKNKLMFDFYLPQYNMCIEYDGIQHFEPISFFGGDKSFEELKIRDDIKNKFCEDNDIKLLRIPYTQYLYIEDILDDNFCFE